mmetsp:Transcript_88108/g.247769  ORF Transcript_88108/g.247769 Transcript_88108/m.247769 type:complete len:180 (+) Transcript_88108:91-630(+)
MAKRVFAACNVAEGASLMRVGHTAGHEFHVATSNPVLGRHAVSFKDEGVPDGNEKVAEEIVEGSPNEMAEAAAQWSRHAAYTSSRAAQAAQYAAQQAQTATLSAQNAVSQMQFLMNHPDLTSQGGLSFVAGAAAVAVTRSARPAAERLARCQRRPRGHCCCRHMEWNASHPVDCFRSFL